MPTLFASCSLAAVPSQNGASAQWSDPVWEVDEFVLKTSTERAHDGVFGDS